MVSLPLDQDLIWNGNVDPSYHTKGNKVVNSDIDHSNEKDSKTGKFTRRLKPRSHELSSTVRSGEEHEIPLTVDLD